MLFQLLNKRIIYYTLLALITLHVASNAQTNTLLYLFSGKFVKTTKFDYLTDAVRPFDLVQVSKKNHTSLSDDSKVQSGH